MGVSFKIPKESKLELLNPGADRVHDQPNTAGQALATIQQYICLSVQLVQIDQFMASILTCLYTQESQFGVVAESCDHAHPCVHAHNWIVT